MSLRDPLPDGRDPDDGGSVVLWALAGSVVVLLYAAVLILVS